MRRNRLHDARFQGASQKFKLSIHPPKELLGFDSGHVKHSREKYRGKKRNQIVISFIPTIPTNYKTCDFHW